MNNIHKFTEELLIDPINESRQEEVFCQICQCFLIEPHEHSICGKLICKSCLTERKKTHTTCPYCVKPFLVDGNTNVHFSKRIELIVLNLKISCYHTECKKIMCIRDTDKHIKNECEYEPVPCSDCQQNIIRFQLAEHKQICHKRLMVCLLCGILYKFDEHSAHKKVCAEEAVKCRIDNCDQMVRNKDLYNHMSKCDYAILTCAHCKDYKQIRKFYERDNHGNTCPMRLVTCNKCNAKIFAGDLQKHMDITCVERLVSCNFCKQSIVCKHMNDHKSFSCCYRSVLCKLCQTYIIFKNLDKHNTEQCIHRPAKCPHCNDTIKLSELPKHETICPEYKTYCSKCNIDIKRKELPCHSLLCPNVLVACPHNDWTDCTFVCDRKDMDKHSSDKDSHIVMAKKYVKSLEFDRSPQHSSEFVPLPFAIVKPIYDGGKYVVATPLFAHKFNGSHEIHSSMVRIRKDLGLAELKPENVYEPDHMRSDSFRYEDQSY